MTELEWGRLTWPELRDRLAHPRAVALLPIGATEAHGPHLPLDTDVVIARAVALAAARGLEAEGFAPLVLPPLAYGICVAAASFPGTVGNGTEALRLTLLNLAAAVASQGVRRLAIVNHHLEPDHVRAIEAVATEARLAEGAAIGLRLILPRHWRAPHRLALGDEFATGDAHAGRYETSMVLAADPAAVREEKRSGLAPRWVGLIAKLRAGVRSFEEAGAPEAYVGDPAAATAEEGERTIGLLAALVVEAVKEGFPHGGA